MKTYNSLIVVGIVCGALSLPAFADEVAAVPAAPPTTQVTTQTTTTHTTTQPQPVQVTTQTQQVHHTYHRHYYHNRHCSFHKNRYGHCCFAGICG